MTADRFSVRGADARMRNSKTAEIRSCVWRNKCSGGAGVPSASCTRAGSSVGGRVPAGGSRRSRSRSPQPVCVRVRVRNVCRAGTSVDRVISLPIVFYYCRHCCYSPLSSIGRTACFHSSSIITVRLRCEQRLRTIRLVRDSEECVCGGRFATSACMVLVRVE